MSFIPEPVRDLDCDTPHLVCFIVRGKRRIWQDGPRRASVADAERAAQAGVQLSFRDHVKAGVLITLVALLFAEW